MPKSYLLQPAELARDLGNGWLAAPLSSRRTVLIDETEEGIEIDAFYDALLGTFLDASPISPAIRARLRELLASTGTALFILGAGRGNSRAGGHRSDADAAAAISALLETAALSGDPRLADMLRTHGYRQSPLSVEFGAEYRATIRALLPRFRQVELDGEFELPGRLFLPAPDSDFAPMGQRWYFNVSVCLLLQSLLIRHGITAPVAIPQWVIDCFDPDWRRAVWRLIMGNPGPVVVVGREHAIRAAEWEKLAHIDWSTGATQIARIRQRTGGAWGGAVAESEDAATLPRSFFWMRV